VARERILVVDDEPGVRSALEGVLTDEGYFVTTVATGEAGLEAVGQGEFDAILLDVWLPGLDGLETLRRLGEQRADAEVVMISGHGNIETAVRATKLGAFDFVEKPLSLEKTLLVLRNALRQRRLERRNRALLEQLSQRTAITGASAVARGLGEAVAIAAASDAPVLICGEPGSGREGVARRIHATGPRAAGPFVAVPCGALDAPTVESLLFSREAPPGRIDLAGGGSLFLEDADRLEPAVQLRLASQFVARSRERESVRLLASSQPEGMALEEPLRQRLDVIRIAVPALRERREDLTMLAEKFMGDIAREYGRAPKQLSSDCLVALKSHDWPGNLVELRNLMERLLLFVSGDVVRRADLPDRLGGARPAAQDLYGDLGTLKQGLARFQQHYVRRVLAEENSDMDRAAERLGLTRGRLAKLLDAPESG